MFRRLGLLLFIVFQGVIVSAAEPTMSVIPDQGFYRPGQAMRLNITDVPGGHLEVSIRFQDQTVARLAAPLERGAATISWQPPADFPRGYGVDVRALATDGTPLAVASTAFDVLSHWTQAPRYGFFSDFRANRGDDAAMQDWLLTHHLNGVQFYDWQYRWEQLLPPNDNFQDGLGRPQSMITIRRLIDLCHQVGAAAMPYTAIYGVSIAFYRQHPQWALMDAAGASYLFGEDFMAILDPTPGSPWNQHLLAEYAALLAQTAFDGIHIDQYGAPKNAFNAADEPVDLAAVMPGFIDQTAALVQAARGEAGTTLFNAVGNWPVETVAGAGQAAVYIEVWPPYTDFADLHRIITQAQRLSNGKAVILAAYIPPDQRFNWQLANAVIFASGGWHIETGEPVSMLADPYFPKFGPIAPADQALFRRYYDFLVRYENRLSVGTWDAPSDRSRISAGDCRTGGIRAQNRLLPILRQGVGFETVSLVNFIGLEESDWNRVLPHPPTPLTNLVVQIPVERSVGRVWYASPDREDTITAQPLDFNVVDGSLHLTLPCLDYWAMIVVEYTDA